MELKDYLSIIAKSWLSILFTTLAITLIVIVWSTMIPLKYESSATVVVNKPNTVPQRGASYYQYDKYYSIQASSLQADTLTAWLSSPSTAKEIYEKADLPVPDVNLKKLSRIFKPRRLPPATLNITVKDAQKERAEKLVAAAVAVLEDKTAEQRRGDDPEQQFNLISGAIVTAEAKPDKAINAALGLVAGLFFGLVIAFGGEYRRHSRAGSKL